MVVHEFKTALITGATSGIGEALVDLLSRQQVSLLLTGRNLKKLEELQEKYSGEVPVEILALDLGNAAERQRLVRLMREKVPDLVINNAGFGLYGAAIDLSTEEQMQVLEVDCAAAMEITIEAAKTLVAANREGTIMNISSAAAFQVFPGFAVYAASKAFLNHLSLSLDYELKDRGVRVLAACPGQVRTGFSMRAGRKGENKSNHSMVMTADFAAHRIWDQILAGWPVNIFNWKYRLLTFISKFLPNSLIAKILVKEIKKRKTQHL